MSGSSPHSALDEARLALRVWMRGQQPSRDHPGVVLGDCLDRLEEQNEFHTGEVAMLSEKLDGLREQFEAVSSLLVELARWSRVAERDGDLHARIASALAMPERDTSAAVVDGAEILGYHETVGERQGRQPAPAPNPASKPETPKRPCPRCGRHEWVYLAGTTNGTISHCSVCDPAREPHKSPCPNCGSSTWVLRWGKTDGLEEGCNKCRPLPDHAPASSESSDG